MSDGQKFKTGKLLLGLTLVIMVLMRLVWMDLRSYTITMDPKAMLAMSEERADGPCLLKGKSLQFPQQLIPVKHLPDWSDSFLFNFYVSLSCDNGYLNTNSYVRMNQGLLIISIIMCVLLTRFFARNWLLCLTTAALLMSRGRLITTNGDVSGQSLLMVVLTLWFCLMCHWIRSGSAITRVITICFPMFLATIDFSLGLLCLSVLFAYGSFYLLRKSLTYPLFKKLRWDLSISRKSHEDEPPNVEDTYGAFTQSIRNMLGWTTPFNWGYRPIKLRYRTGALFRSLDVPFILWLQHKKLWSPLLMGLAIVAVLQLGVLTSLSLFEFDLLHTQINMPLKSWFEAFTMPIDLDIAVSLVILGACLLLNPVWGLTSFWEAIWLLLWSIAFAGAGAFLWDNFSQFGMHAKVANWKAGEVLLWFEPVILTFAIIAVYHLSRCIDQKYRTK